MRCLWAWAAAAVLYLSIACDIDICHAQPQVRTDIRTVATDVQFQRAVRDNVRHIVVIDHIDMVRSQREFEGAGDSLNSGVVAVKSATKSIVGQCTGPPPAAFGLTEPVPPGACAVVVREDFMEVGLDVTELWLHRLYIAGAPSSAASLGLATLILHKAGEVWLTGSVLQGRSVNSRAVDVTSADGGNPRLYMEDVAVVHMIGCNMPGVRCGPGTDCTFNATSFKHNAIPFGPSHCECGSAIGVQRGGSALLVDVDIVNNTILSAPAGARAVAAYHSGPDPAVVFSEPPRNIWDISTQSIVPTRPASEAHTAPNLPENGTYLHGIQMEQAQLWAALAPPVPNADAPGGHSSGGNGGDNKTQALEAAVGAIGGVLGLLTLTALAALVCAYVRRAHRGGSDSDRGSFKLGRLNAHRNSGPEIPKSVDGATLPFGLAHTSTNYPPSFAHLGRGPSFSHSSASIPITQAPPMPLPPGAVPSPTGTPPPPGALTAAPAMSWQPPYVQNPALVRSYSSHSYPAVLPWSGGRQGPLGSQNSSAALPPLDAAPSSTLTLMDGGSAHGGTHGLAVRAPGVLGFLGGSFRAPERHGSVGAVGLPLLTPEGATHSTTLDTTAVPPLPPPDAESGEAAVLDRPLLEHALDNMHAGEELFMGKFVILGPLERRAGGQGIVQFAVARPTGEPVAIKFFLNRKAFDCEAALYEKAHLRSMMPAVTLVHSNDDASIKTHEGWYFPPCIVVERGESLDEWGAHVKPDFCTIAQVLIHVTERVATLHAAGVVHRDLKPGNVLWRPRNHAWTLIDYGCAAEIGSISRLTFSMAYSPPETLQALHAGAQTITSDAASDIWAIGVITYELVLGRPAFTAREWTREQLTQAALGEYAYPWEAPGQPGQFRHIPQARGLSSSLRACLNRNPSRRPTAAELQSRVNQLFDDSATTSETAPCRDGATRGDKSAGFAPRGAGAAPCNDTAVSLPDGAAAVPPCSGEAEAPQHQSVLDMPSARSWAITTSSIDNTTTHGAGEATPMGSHTGRTRHIFNVPPGEGPPVSPAALTLSAEIPASQSAALMPKLADVYRGLPGVLSTESLTQHPQHSTQQQFIATGSMDSEMPPAQSQGASAAEGGPTHTLYSDIPPALLPLSFETRGGSLPLPQSVDEILPQSPAASAAGDAEGGNSGIVRSDLEEAGGGELATERESVAGSSGKLRTA